MAGWARERLSSGRVSIHTASGKRVVTDMVLFSVGRVGATDELELGAAGLAVDERGDKKGHLSPIQVLLCKRNNVKVALDVARKSRGILGGNGILLEYPVMHAF